MCDRHNLLIDVGNSTIKYAWFSGGQDISDLQVLRTSMDGLADLLVNTKVCYFSCVKSHETAALIVSMCKQQKVDVRQIQTQERQFGIKNAYRHYLNMGCDRWMAIVAGGALSHRNYIVIDAGTAITCDFVVGQQHIGGWIAPGLQLARTSVVNNTTKVFDDCELPKRLSPGIDTPDCVAQGVLAQLTGMLVQAKIMMYQHSSAFDVFISGGDAATLISLSDIFANETENLAEKRLSEMDSLGETSNTSRKVEKNHNKTPIFSSALGSTNYIENIVLVGLARVAHGEAFATG